MKKERLEERFGIKVLITILCLTVVQLGNIIPIPTINTAYFSYLVSKTSVLGMMNRFSGGAFQNMTLCALGISIYISASIVIQMLTVVFRKLEELELKWSLWKETVRTYHSFIQYFFKCCWRIFFWNHAASKWDLKRSKMDNISDHRWMPLFWIFITDLTWKSY